MFGGPPSGRLLLLLKFGEVYLPSVQDKRGGVTLVPTRSVAIATGPVLYCVGGICSIFVVSHSLSTGGVAVAVWCADRCS